MARSEEPSDSDIREELRRELLPAISLRELAAEITDLLKLLGRKPGTPEEVGAALARKLISRFARPNRKIEQLIDHRPRQLHAMLGEIVWDEIQQLIKANPQILHAKAPRAKIATDEAPASDPIHRTRFDRTAIR